MKPEELRELLVALERGERKVDEVAAQIEQARANASVESLGFARIDHDRARRRGFPEVIYGPGKEPAQLAEIFGRLAARNPNVLATRATPEGAAAVRALLPETEYLEGCGVLRLWREREPKGLGAVTVVSAGTSDQKVAREAAACAEVMGNEVRRLDDVGVAGLQRVLGVLEELRQARVLICVAGFEAALPSVVAGLVERPVIAVPTSVGYGATFGGAAALLGCLSACSAGVATVNIDNGFGAAYAASLMNRP